MGAFSSQGERCHGGRTLPPESEYGGLWEVSPKLSRVELPHRVPPPTDVCSKSHVYRVHPTQYHSVSTIPQHVAVCPKFVIGWGADIKFRALTLSPAPHRERQWSSEAAAEPDLPAVPSEGTESELLSAEEELPAGSSAMSGGEVQQPGEPSKPGAPGAPANRLVAHGWGLARARRAKTAYLPRD